MKAKRKQVDEKLQVINLFASNYARDLLKEAENYLIDHIIICNPVFNLVCKNNLLFWFFKRNPFPSDIWYKITYKKIDNAPIKRKRIKDMLPIN